jgi:hypothetical protein
MKSLAWISAVVALSLALVGGLMVAVQVQAEPRSPVPDGIGDERVDPAALELSPGLTVTQSFTVYQPLTAKSYWGFLMYADDFSDPATGWYVGEIPEVRWGYADGEYEILIRNGPSWAGVTAPFQGIDGYAYEFDVRRQGGPGNLYGSIFGWSDWGHFYLFVVAPDLQYYGVFRRSDTDWVPVIDWEPSDHIHAGDATNRLRVERWGSQLAVSANGTELASAVEGTHVGELRFGLYAEAAESVPVATRYDNVLITQLSGARAQGSGTEPAAPSRASNGGGTALLHAPEVGKAGD